MADPAALQAAADALTPAVLQERCDSWAAKLAPSFSPADRAAMDLRYRYSLGQIEPATDVIFAEPSPLRARFRRAVELGLLPGGADRTAHPFGWQITSRYRGKRQTVLDRRDKGHPVLRAYDRTSFVKQYEQAESLLRTQTCILACPDAGGDPYHLDVGRRLENLAKLVTRMADTNQRFLDARAELLACTVDRGSWLVWPSRSDSAHVGCRACACRTTGSSRCSTRCSIPAALSPTGPLVTSWHGCSTVTASPRPTTA